MDSVEVAVITARLDAIHEDVLEVKEQAKITNGRVTNLERWKDRITGAWMSVSLLGPVITGLTVGLVLKIA